MNVKFVDLHAQYLSIKEEVDEAIASVIRDSAFIRGKHVDAFEKNFAHLLGIDHCVSCANGTEALYIALKSLGIGLGDEVITTAHSWISTSETITQTGARVVFCDTEGDYYCIDPGLIEDRISEKTKAIIVVHLFGQPADMDPILEIARKHDLRVIEDCAQSHLATYKGRHTGTMGDIGTFSFYPAKNLGAMGDAGCLVTNGDDLAERTALFARHGGKNEHLIEGINSRMDGLQAAVLNAKMSHLKDWTAARRTIAELYDDLLSGCKFVKTPKRRPDCKHVFHLYVIRCEHRDELRHFLQQEGISTQLNYPRALPFYPAYEYLAHQPGDFPVAYRHMNQILSLPIFPEIVEDDVKLVANKIMDFSS